MAGGFGPFLGPMKISDKKGVKIGNVPYHLKCQNRVFTGLANKLLLEWIGVLITKIIYGQLIGV